MQVDVYGIDEQGGIMGVTKAEMAKTLGVSKGTIANYIERLGLEGHVERVGNADRLDEHAASALAAAIGTDKAPTEEAEAAPNGVIDAQAARIADLKAELDRAKADYEARLAAKDAEADALRAELKAAHEQLVEASKTNGRLSADLADALRRQQDIAERQAVIAAAPWWRRWSLATKLLGSGEAR